MTAIRTETEPTDGASSAPFFRTLAGRVRVLDVLALAVVPLVLVAVFLLPESTRRVLTFQYTEPTLLTAYTAHFVHLEATHLAGNLAGYFLLASVCYALAVLSRRRRFFLSAFATFLIAFPFLLSALNLAVPRNAIGYGFSGINMALLGVLPLLLVAYAREQFFPHLRPQHAPLLFVLTLAGVSLMTIPTERGGVVLAGGAVAVGGIYVASLRRTWTNPPSVTLQTVLAREGYGDLLVGALVLFVTYPAVGFPSDIATEGQVLNLYVHLLGFCLAFIGPYALSSLGVYEE